MEKASYDFSTEELTLTEKVLARLEKRLQRENIEQPRASLWIENPTLVADVQILLKRLRNRVSKVVINEIIGKLLKREIEHAITIHPEKWLKLLYGVTDTEMKRLHLKVSNRLK